MRKALAFAVVICTFAVTGAAQAASWDVALGEQARPPAGTPKGATLNGFFPGKLVVNAGDSVTFSSASFHTVTYTAGKPPAPLLLPDPTKGTYAALNDASGTPFPFGGLPKFIYNGGAFAPVGGKTISPGAPVSSGVLSPNGPKAPPAKATYTFPKAGVFKLLCNVHPGMKMTVTVKPAGSPVPLSSAQVTAKTLTDISGAWGKAKALAAQPVPKNTVYTGVGGAPTILGFLPQVLTVKAGTTVRFVNRSPSEVHNVVFGPGKYVEHFAKTTDLFPFGPNAKNQVSPVYLYGSEPKGGNSYDGTNHGNGFLATKLTAGSPVIPLPRADTVKFTKPGTYKYLCLIHGPDMSGTVKVKP